MAENPYKCFNATDRSYFALMKKDIRAIAEQNGFTTLRTGEIDIIVAELASNLIKHGGGGELLVRMMQDNGHEMLEILCIDNGPGMNDPARMMADGFSSTNTLGHGLGSINRLADLFQVYSLKGWGTIQLVRVAKAHSESPVKKQQVAEMRALSVCKPGEDLCGDGASFVTANKMVRIFLGDGLGHGKDANLAVMTAISSFDKSTEADPVELIRNMNLAVKKTRGLVASAAFYCMKEKRWCVCGVGNIATRMFSNMVGRNYIAYNGIIGLNLPGTMKAQSVEHESGQLLVMCSDGIRTRWELQKYPAITRYDLAILCAAIYKDHARRTDDMSIVACRINKNS